MHLSLAGCEFDLIVLKTMGLNLKHLAIARACSCAWGIALAIGLASAVATANEAHPVDESPVPISPAPISPAPAVDLTEERPPAIPLQEASGAEKRALATTGSPELDPVKPPLPMELSGATVASVPSGDGSKAAPSASPVEQDLRFAEAYEIILGRSLRVWNQAAQIDFAEARKFRALGQFAPGVSAQTTRIEDRTTFGRRTANVSATLNVFKGGSDLEALRGARAQVERERAQLQVERQNAEEEGAIALVNAIAKTLIRDIVAQIAASKAEINQAARQRYEKGLLPLQESEKSRIELDNARASLNDAEAVLAEARANLRVLLGQSRIKAEWPWKEALTRDGLAKGDGLADSPFELQKRPDYRAASLLLEADRRRARSAWRALWPSLDLTATYGTDDFVDPGRRDFGVFVTISTQLFDQGRSISFAQERSAIERQTAYAKEGIERRADAQVEIRKQAHRIAVRSALAREKSLESSRSLLDDSEKRFRLGRATVNDLAIDQSRYFESENLAIDGWSQAHVSLLRLCHVLGGSMASNGDCKRP